MKQAVVKTLTLKLAQLRRFIQRGRPMPAAVFDALLQVAPHQTVETAILRRRQGRGEIFLTQRSPRESRYARQWHIPGSFLRFGEDFPTPLERLCREELGGSARFSRTAFTTLINYPDDESGHIVSALFVCRLRGQPRHGRWWRLDALPVNFASCHRPLVAGIARSRSNRLKLPPTLTVSHPR